MTINKTLEDGRLVIALDGRLDTATGPLLQQALIPEFDNVKNINLDFKDIDYVSSAGLRILLMGEKTAQEKGAKMTLSNVTEDVMDIFEMTGFDEMLTFV